MFSTSKQRPSNPPKPFAGVVRDNPLPPVVLWTAGSSLPVLRFYEHGLVPVDEEDENHLDEHVGILWKTGDAVHGLSSRSILFCRLIAVGDNLFFTMYRYTLFVR
jgi:hypothetical protein